MSLFDQAKSVRTRADFVSFVERFRADLAAHPQEWENNTLPAFLEALEAWVHDADGFFANQPHATPDQLDWKTVADMLMGARCYE